MKIKNTITKAAVWLLLQVSALLAWHPVTERLSRWFMRRLADAIMQRKHLTSAEDLPSLGEHWQKAFPSKKHHPIIAISDGWVHAEIHTHCPLRGSGNKAACHRMMEFDRHIVGTAGGVFEVRESQAVTGGHVCKIAMRLDRDCGGDLQR